MTVERPNQVTRRTSPISRWRAVSSPGLVAVVDWSIPGRVLSHRVSITMEGGFCVEALRGGHRQNDGKPEIFNSDQGSSQFTSEAFTSILEKNGIAISMDGKGCWRDNVFVERGSGDR